MKRKIIFILILVGILGSCGSSGGGGGGSSSPATPVTPTIPVTTPDPDPDPGTETTTVKSYVGIIDSDFDAGNTEFLDSEGNSRVLTYPEFTGNGNSHGTLVAEIITGNTIGVASGITVRGVSAGTTCADGTPKCISVQRKMYETLYNDGVRIFNQSFGSEDMITTKTTSDMPLSDNVVSFYFTRALSDSLFIWAAGNGTGFVGNSEVGVEAGLPYLYPSMEKGWLAVVAVDNTNTIASYSNRCGVAANWCIAAPGNYTFYSNSVSGQGTSYAAPTVTAAAALIKQKYEWMNGDLIRQTILSTADDIGISGVDNVYGWGLLNISKAINGPALFDKRLALGSYVNVNFDDVTSTFSNDIGGDAGLIKNGTGTLILSGTSTYSGSTIINGGRVIVNGSILSGVYVGVSGTLSSTGGYIGNDVYNEGGTLENSGTGLQIAGNYSALENSTIRSSVGSTIKVGGTAYLDGTYLILENPVDENNNPVYVSSGNITSEVITADGGIQSSFSSVSSPELLSSEISYSENTVEVSTSRKNVSEYVKESTISDATRDNSAENVELLFKALDNSTESSEIREKAALIQTSSSSVLASTLDSLSGQIYASAQALTFQQSQAVNKDISNRLSMLGILNNTGERAGIWFTGMAARGELSKNGYAKADTTLYGGLMGIDKKFSDNLIIGAVFSFSDAEAEFNRYAGNSESQNLGISVYGRYGLKDSNLYVAGRAGTGFVSSEVKREIVLAGTTEKVSIDHNDYVISGYAETGYTFQSSPNTRIIPFIGLSYDGVERGDFTEDGSSLGLHADKKYYKQFSGLLGLKAEAELGKSTLQGYLTWQRAFNDENLEYEASYAGMRDQKFTVKGIGLPRETMWTGIGILTEISPQWSWYTNYDMQLDGSDISNNVFSVGFRYNLN